MRRCGKCRLARSFFPLSIPPSPPLALRSHTAGRAAKPAEFGTTGQNWEGVGWNVRVQFTRLVNRVRPKDHIEILRPLLPGKYAPLQANGNGIQSIYLTELPIHLPNRTAAGLTETLLG